MPAYQLRVVKGPDKGKHRRVVEPRLVIGTGEGAHFKLGDRFVSQVHCEISSSETGFRVRDLGAKNGVILGGHRVVEAFLGEKDDITMGGTTIRFKASPDDAEEVPLPAASLFGRLRGSSVRMRELYGLLDRA